MRHHGRKWSDTKSSKVDHRYCWQHGRRTDSRDWYSQRRNRCHRWRHPHIKESFHVGWLWIGNQSIENRQSNRFYPHTLTSTLTIFRFGCQTVRQESEGVRVRKEKNYFYYIAIWMGRIHRQRLWDIPIIAGNYTGQNTTTNIWRELWETRWRGQKKRQESKN